MKDQNKGRLESLFEGLEEKRATERDEGARKSEERRRTEKAGKEVLRATVIPKLQELSTSLSEFGQGEIEPRLEGPTPGVTFKFTPRTGYFRNKVVSADSVHFNISGGQISTFSVGSHHDQRGFSEVNGAWVEEQVIGVIERGAAERERHSW